MQNNVFSLPITLARESGESYKQQIVRQMEWMIVSGRLQENDRLPSIAGMVSMLKVSKNTVLGAYEMLVSSGLAYSKHGSGFFVSPDVPSIPENLLAPDFVLPSLPLVHAGVNQILGTGVHANPPASPIRFDFKVGRPSVHAFPWKRWSKLSGELLRDVGWSMAEYTPAEGLWGLRMQISDYLSAVKAINVEPDQVIIVGGSQEALSLLASHFISEGDEVVAESPGYTGFRNLLDLHRAHKTFVPVDEQGLCADLLPERPVRVAYVTPSHQYPLGHTMSMIRRRQLLEWATRNEAVIIEDDYDGDFCYELAPLPPLMAMDPSRVVYLGTFSKALGPGLRLGYMVCPPALVESIGRRKSLLNNGCAWLNQAVMARFFEEGEYSRHIYSLRQRYRLQRDELLRGIQQAWKGEGSVTGQGAGMHLALRLPDGSSSAHEIARNALQYGVRLYPLDFAASAGNSKEDERTLLFGYASMEVDQISMAMSLLNGMVSRFRK